MKLMKVCSLSISIVVTNLLQVIKNPITDHLPTGCRKIGTSYHADLCVDLNQFATNQPIVFVVGAMAHGKVYQC